jgi:acetyl-CoA carboxylase carboxyltransferase component
LAELHRRRNCADNLGGVVAVERAHARGLLTAPERLELLLDPGSRVPFGTLFHSDNLSQADETFGDGELDGFGTIDGRWVAYFASDPRVKGGSGGPADFLHAETFRNIVEKAALPLIYLMQGGGARIDEAMSSQFIAFPATGMGVRKVFPRRGVFLTAVLGSYYAPWNVAQADFSVMTESSNISLTAPPLVYVGTGQQVTAEELGGAQVQARVTGQIDAVVPDEVAALAMVRVAFGYLPSRAGIDPPIVDCGDSPDRSCPELYDIVPTALNRAYDVRRVITTIVDRNSFLEFSPEFARNLVTGLARMNGRTVLLIANQPKFLAGVIDSGAVIKAKKIFNLCNELDLPLLSLVDTPGVLPTKEQEHRGVMTALYEHGIRRFRPTAPKVTVVLRKGVGFAIGAMSGGDPEGITFAWPNSQICFTGVEACVRVVHRREIEESDDPSALITELSERYTGTSAPWSAAHVGYLDDVIDPAETRMRVIRAFEVTRRHR